jgi:hypothetical protein
MDRDTAQGSYQIFLNLRFMTIQAKAKSEKCNNEI